MDTDYQFPNKDNYFVNNFHVKAHKKENLEIFPTICCWTDLLGFGKPFKESNWKPNKMQWGKILNRLREVSKILSQTDCSFPDYNFCLFLNDGIIRNFDFGKLIYQNSINSENALYSLSFWLRSCVIFHNLLKKTELENNYPGPRTIIASGERGLYSYENIYFDDLVLNYTKASQGGLSNAARLINNPIIISNPKQLQMNTAFSKAYIIDDNASKFGMKDSTIYIENDVLNLIKSCISKDNMDLALHLDEQQDHIIFGIPDQTDTSYILGFKLKKPAVHFDYNEIRDDIYQLLSFYPWDEDKNFELEIL